MKLNVKNMLLVARSEYIKWLMNPRMVMLLVILVPIRELIILPMLRAAQEMNQPLNIFESCIAAVNSGWIILLMPLAYIVLISSFPTADDNMMFYISRMGRKNWILGEMLFQVLSAATYCLVMMSATLVQTANHSFLANGWSIPVTDYDKVFGEAATVRMDVIVPPNLYFQMSPYKAFFLSYFLMFLFLLLCSMIFLVGCLFSRKLLFFFLLMIQIAVGCALQAAGTGMMWFFPISHSVLRAHYRSYFRQYIFSPWLSMGVFFVLLVCLAAISYRRANKVNLDMIGGHILS